MPRRTKRRKITRLSFAEIAYKIGLSPKQKIVMRRLLLERQLKGA